MSRELEMPFTVYGSISSSTRPTESIPSSTAVEPGTKPLRTSFTFLTPLVLFVLVCVFGSAAIGAVALSKRFSRDDTIRFETSEDYDRSSVDYTLSAEMEEDSSLDNTTDNYISKCTMSIGACPNIIMITLDDVGYNDMGYLSTDIPFSTPNLDRMRAEGVELTNYYGQSLCTPARATLMSGKFVHRIGFSTVMDEIEIQAFSNYSVALENKLMTSYLDELGYAVHVIGKWNIGHCSQDYLPWNRGAKSFYGILTAGIDYTTHQVHDNTTILWQGAFDKMYDLMIREASGDLQNGLEYKGVYSTQLFTDRAIKLIDDHYQEVAVDGNISGPIFIWLAYNAPHDDQHPHPPGLTAQEQELLHLNRSLGHKRAMFARVMMDVDNSISYIIQTLNATNMLDETVIILNSDNGADPCGDYLVGDNYPLRGSKMTFFEGGLRVPAFVYAPGILPEVAKGSSYGGLMHHVDWLATIVEGLTQTDGAISPGTDSINHWGQIKTAYLGNDTPHLRDYIIWSLGSNYAAIRRGDMKLMVRMHNSTWYGDEKETSNQAICIADDDVSDGRLEVNNFLFNITADPYERNNLFYDTDHKPVLSSLIKFGRNKKLSEGYAPTYDFGETINASAVETVMQNDRYVTYWGCAVQ